MQTELKTRHLFVMRHGQRKDHVPEQYPEYVGHPDAPLTPLGYQQAQETGVFLKGRLDELKKEHCPDGNLKIMLECSPFIRCLQTSACLATELGVDKVKFNWRFSEHLEGTRHYPHWDPMPRISTQNCDSLEDLAKDFDLKGIKFEESDDFKEEMFRAYPETFEIGQERIAKNMKHMHGMVNEQEEQFVVQIVVSHGFHTNVIHSNHNRGRCGYGSVTELKFTSDNQDGFEELRCSDSSHVSVQKLNQ